MVLITLPLTGVSTIPNKFIGIMKPIEKVYPVIKATLGHLKMSEIGHFLLLFIQISAIVLTSEIYFSAILRVFVTFHT